MQLFVLHRDPDIAAKMLVELDPVRARKQLIETNQALASINPHHPMIKKNGLRYSIKAHRNHPVTKWINSRVDNRRWVLWFQYHLALQFPNHAASISFMNWFMDERDSPWINGTYHEYFGTFDVPGDTVYEKYRNYILVKQGKMQI